jgi:hypothetical protein
MPALAIPAEMKANFGALQAALKPHGNNEQSIFGIC